jgi:hypothetical protein
MAEFHNSKPLTGFAEACYNQNSIDDLIECLEGPHADRADCDEWKLSHQEWREAIADALRGKVADLKEMLADRNGAE